MALPSLNIVRDEFKFMTLLYTGAFIQALFFVVCPHRIVALPAILVIFCSVAKNLLQQFGLLPGKTFSDLRKGRWTAQLVNADGSIPESGDGKGKSVVVFLLGARSNRYVLD
ncbi:hypothetical protein OCU04_005342 [Sclerotinia nivalis]|uniref:Uncharacterized protein n=1 Tax=Sclerotinia nivalis TaxID=352851 RepID=A0A9X0ANW9_9HELO|nr:hypothetical protein OCU04_005342 [Sclerotinia nivalis]